MASLYVDHGSFDAEIEVRIFAGTGGGTAFMVYLSLLSSDDLKDLDILVNLPVNSSASREEVPAPVLLSSS